MKFGFLTGQGRITQPDPIVALAQHLEEVGFDAIMVPDHIVCPVKWTSLYADPGGFDGGPYIQEQMTTLAFLAGKTKSIRLVPFVNVLPMRHPLVTAKMLTTIDILSKGRLSVCVGAGWWEEEFRALGVPNYEERGNVTDEYILVLKEAWTHERPSFNGKYVQFSDITFSPRPIQTPHPPIWVGGESYHAIRRAGELADGWFPIGDTQVIPLKALNDIAVAKARLDRHRTKGISTQPSYEFGYRVPKGILEGEPADVIKYIHNLEKLGVTYVNCLMQGAREHDDLDAVLTWVDRFATKILPEFKGP